MLQRVTDLSWCRQCNQRSGVVSVMNDLYVGAFHQFHVTWQTQHKTIADCGHVLAGQLTHCFLATYNCLYAIRTVCNLQSMKK